MRRRDAILIVTLAAMPVLVCAGVVTWPIIAESYEKPDPAKMRAYRLSLLTDAQVLGLHDRAIAESAKQEQWAEQQDKSFWADRQRAMDECESNPAVKLRDPDHCFRPIPLGMMDGGNKTLVEPPDALFEQYAMGICSMVHSVREARQSRCLP